MNIIFTQEKQASNVSMYSAEDPVWRTVMLRFYDSPTSGNAYKIHLLLKQLQIPFEHVLLNSRQGETRTPEYLQKNPYGQVPAIENESGQILAESGAILSYLAEGTPFSSTDAWERAQILQWLFFEQTRITRTIAITRFWLQTGKVQDYSQQIKQNQELAIPTLAIVEAHLRQHSFLVGERYTIADIALFTYIYVAHEAEIDMSPYSALHTWIDRIEAQPHYFKFSP